MQATTNLDPTSHETLSLDAATQAVDIAAACVDAALSRGRSADVDLDAHQQFAYDVAHAASGLEMARSALAIGARGDDEAALTHVFIGYWLHSFATSVWTRPGDWGVEPDALEPMRAYLAAATDPSFVASHAATRIPSSLPDDLSMVADTFRKFGRDKIAPHAEHIHREDLDIPTEIIDGVAELGCFGLSIPTEYGGFAEGTENDYLAMVIATEELSSASLGAGGSLITRPEILARALEAGGTDAQKQRWLPSIAGGETLCAVSVTEPDFGSDVAGLKTTATRVDGGWRLNGVKTWCTFAGRANVLMVLARTNPDPEAKHRGLSVFIVEKPSDAGHAFSHTADGGAMTGRAIPTIGYRGMHSFEVSFEDWFVPAENLIGGADGEGRGFYLQMAGFENGRLQTAARAVGVMQRALDLASAYADDRVVFGQSIADYQLTRVKLATMAAIIAVSREYSYDVARQMAGGDGALQAAMAKAFVCKAAEWVTREALQIHGGMGYAEEYEVSRLFVDARVLSIFEGADETLCLKLIARRLFA